MEKDMDLMIDGMGIVFFSPETNKAIPEGMDFFSAEYQRPEDVAAHIRKGDVVGFCTGTGGDFTLKFRDGYPSEALLSEYPIAIRLGIDLQDGKMCAVDLFSLMSWSSKCPENQTITVEPGIYHLTLCTRKPDSGIWGDYQTIYVYMNKLDAMPQLMWDGVPYLGEMEGHYFEVIPETVKLNEQGDMLTGICGELDGKPVVFTYDIVHQDILIPESLEPVYPDIEDAVVRYLKDTGRM